MSSKFIAQNKFCEFHIWIQFLSFFVIRMCDVILDIFVKIQPSFPPSCRNIGLFLLTLQIHTKCFILPLVQDSFCFFAFCFCGLSLIHLSGVVFRPAPLLVGKLWIIRGQKSGRRQISAEKGKERDLESWVCLESVRKRRLLKCTQRICLSRNMHHTLGTN
jgi:hypothetical protein